MDNIENERNGYCGHSERDGQCEQCGSGGNCGEVIPRSTHKHVKLFYFLIFEYMSLSLQTKSGKELYAFLFNDFLLLTQPSRAISDKSIVFNSDSKLDVKFKMYRNVSFIYDFYMF